MDAATADAAHGPVFRAFPAADDLHHREAAAAIRTIGADVAGQGRKQSGIKRGHGRSSQRRRIRKIVMPFSEGIMRKIPERFRAKWVPVRVKKTRRNKDLEPVPMQSERKRL